MIFRRSIMAIAALVAWVLTAAGGFVMLAKWISHGGLHQQHDATTRFPAGLVFSHLGLAAAGLLLWIAYLLLDNDRLAWIAFVVLLPVAGLGVGMFARWGAGRRRAALGVTASGAATAGGALPAEQTLPVPVVAAHGVFAVATVVLVLLAALAG
jgi:acyl-CoA synthetase (AMP-forming)/AMP-acid ligase II